MKNIIVMSGDIGSGKSSVAGSLKQMTGYDVIGTGAIQRAIAKRRGVTTLELNQISQTDRSIDDEIDSYVVNIGKTENNLIIDSRLAWHFIPNAFKVFLAVDPVVGAERVFQASRSDEDNPSLAATLSNNLKRQTIEDQRFHALYHVYFRDYNNYDLVIDTSYTSPETIAEKIKSCFEQWLQQQPCAQIWIDPKKLIPTRAVSTVLDSDYQAVLSAMQSQGFQAQQAVNVFVHNGFLYIADGHKRTLAAHKANVDLIPAHLLNDNELAALTNGQNAEQMSAAVSADTIRAWEQALAFQYKLYPDQLGQQG